MRFLFFINLLLICSKAFGIHLLMSEGDVSYDLKKRAYHEVLLIEDYPMCLMHKQFPSNQGVMEEKLRQIHPNLGTIWVPTSLFQLFVLHHYFTDAQFYEFVQNLGYNCGYYDKNNSEEIEKYKNHVGFCDLNIDKKVVDVLANPLNTIEDLFSLYKQLNSQEQMCAFFLKINDAFLKQYSECMADDLLSKIPHKIEIWQNKRFPFLFNPFAKESIELLLHLFKEKSEMIHRVIVEETLANQESLHLIYRGSEVIFFNARGEEKNIPLLFLPLKGKNLGEAFSIEGGESSFSLSYANSFLGGLFFSLDACAARYSQSFEKNYIFHGLKVGRKALIEDSLFCIPPLHPFVEMLVDGEWFHPHSKIVPNVEDPRCHGWYAKCNRTFVDRIGFLMRRDISSEELAHKLLKLAASNALILHTTLSVFSIVLSDHLEPLKSVN